MHSNVSYDNFQNLLLSAIDSLRRRQIARTIFLMGLVSLAPAPARSSHVVAATLPANFTESQYASGLTNPTAMAFAPDGRLFVCQQGGQLRVIKNGALLPAPFVTLTVDSSGERGLLGVAFDPNFVANQFVYVYYTATSPATHNRVSRFTANVDVAVAGSELPLLDLNNLSSATNHNGGAIHFGPDGKLYVAAGENANSANSQSLGNLLGKLLRINSDGTIPADNPTTFPGIAGSPAGINRAIWSVGLRNPYTFTFQPGTGRMFINDVGQNTWEEIDDGIAGSNYAWSICEGFCSPANANFRDPLFEYGHGTGPTVGCAITGGAFYNPTSVQFPSDYAGKYFFAEFCGGWIRRFDPATGTATAFATGINSPVDLIVTADGSLYYLARGVGAVFRVQYTAPTSNNGVISGQVSTQTGVAVSGTVINLSGRQIRKTITDANGNYRFSNVETNNLYTVTPSRSNYGFSPGSRSFSLTGSSTDAAFTATFNGDTANPLDTPEYFVRQQYVDVLGREPDEGGFNYWSNQILACGGSALCVSTRRRDVAAAFFIEQEFQDTGSFIYNLYQGGLSRRPSFTEYAADRQQVVGGANLEARKQAFAEALVQRAEFTNRYQTSTTAESFVDALLANVQQATGVDLSSRRSSLITRYNSGTSQTQSRSFVLRDLTENAAVRSATYNAGFVLTEYFGYLRRNPDQGGYNFWLNVLNTGDPGNYRGMVCSFITSTEYQRRFSAIVSHSNAECGQ
ncbi:MAG: glucose/sorbosone dehydrogenase [Acidobacteria bacterium]|nr:glucose/sorbosone dehydrogenase [Acidobacteriota bacterium]